MRRLLSLEVVMAILRYSPGGIEEYDEKTKLLEPVLKDKFEHVTSYTKQDWPK
jgi:hypothetical protein